MMLTLFQKVWVREHLKEPQTPVASDNADLGGKSLKMCDWPSHIDIEKV
jgi:hypothetical protein